MFKNIIRAIVLATIALATPFSFAFADSPTLTIQSLSPGTTVSAGNEVYFMLAPSGFSGTPTYTVTDSLSGTTVTNSDVYSSGAFVWIPASSDSGTHNLTITATDSLGATATANQQIVVNGTPTVTIQSIAPGSSVSPNQTVTFSTLVAGFTNPSYSVTDSLVGSSILASNINSSGNFSWTPKSYDSGAHSITVNVTDSAGHSASAVQSITVGAAATGTITLLSPGAIVASGQTVTFTVTPTGFTNPTYTTSDSSYGSSLSNYSVNSSGNFSWTPTVNDVGVHTISVHISDSTGNSATVSQTITVQSGGMTLSAVNPGTTVSPGTVVTFTATTTGFTSPSFSASDTFSGGTLSSGNINTSGYFSWTPNLSDVGGHVITIRAIDGYGHVSTGNVLITVVSSGTTGTTNTSTIQTNTSTGAGYVFTAALSLGSSGADVTALQNLLIKKGFYSGPVTGYFGLLTSAAVKSFQTANGISAVGNVGPATRAALNGQSSSSTTSSSGTTNTSANDGFKFYSPLSLGSTGNDVTEIQKRLTAEGVYSGPITGYYGSLTVAAVKQYQGQHGLTQLGNVGPGTRAALNQ